MILFIIYEIADKNIFCSPKKTLFFVSKKNLNYITSKISFFNKSSTTLLLLRVLFIAPKSEEHDFLHFKTKIAPSRRVLFGILRRARSQNESALRVLFSLGYMASPQGHCL